MVEVGPIAAFAAGVISFLSPCVLPLVPGYISLISGASIDRSKGEAAGPSQRLIMLNSVMFVLGLSLVFISLGAVATSLGGLVRQYYPVLTVAAGIVIIIFGLHLTGVFKINALYADKRLNSLKGGATPAGAFLVGVAFAFGWSPCIGPILATILAFASVQETVTRGVVLLAFYSAGLALPFLLTSLGIGRFLAFYGRFRQHLHKVEVFAGVLLIAAGTLIMFRKFTLLSGYLSFLNDFVIRIEKAIL